MRNLGLLAGAVLAVAACARQPEPLTISEITVDADLTAVGSQQAVDYWKNLSGDLETAIAAQFVGQIDPLGKRVHVDVDELTMASNFAAGASIQDTVLSGRVTVENPDGTTAGAYDVTASSSDAVTFMPPGTDVVRISPASREYYQAIVQAFARGAAQTIAATGA